MENLIMNNLLVAWMPSGAELICILAILILLFGGKKLPELARSLGLAKKEFQKGTKAVDEEIDQISKSLTSESDKKS